MVEIAFLSMICLSFVLSIVYMINKFLCGVKMLIIFYRYIIKNGVSKSTFLRQKGNTKLILTVVGLGVSC